MLQPPQSGSVDVVSNRNPSLSARHCGLSRHGVPKPSPFFTRFVCTWNMICLMEVRGGTQWRLSVGLPVPCGGSYFTSSHFLFLFWFGRALCSRVMGQRYGCFPVRVGERETGRESEFIGAPGGILMLSEFNPSGKTVILRSALFVLFPFWYWPLCHKAVVGYDPF